MPVQRQLFLGGALFPGSRFFSSWLFPCRSFFLAFQFFLELLGLLGKRQNQLADSFQRVTGLLLNAFFCDLPIMRRLESAG